MGKFKRKLMSINKYQVIGIAIALTIALIGYIFLNETDVFYFLIGISFFIGGLPFFLALIVEGNVTREKDEMFLEFSRNLVESVKAGTPISKSILNVSNKDYGVLKPYIEKLGNQISLGIPIKTALETFARDIGSQTVARAVVIISESEQAGGQIEDILESVVKSVSQVQKLRKERTATIYTLVVQGYIIFIIFLVIMVVMQFKILPIAASFGDSFGETEGSGMGASGLGSILGASGDKATPEELARPFIWLLLVQGFFAGLVIGKLSEGSIKSGLKHSFVLIVMALMIYTGARFFFGSPVG